MLAQHETVLAIEARRIRYLAMVCNGLPAAAQAG
jgi:hypothetical protein